MCLPGDLFCRFISVDFVPTPLGNSIELLRESKRSIFILRRCILRPSLPGHNKAFVKRGVGGNSPALSRYQVVGSTSVDRGGSDRYEPEGNGVSTRGERGVGRRVWAGGRGRGRATPAHFPRRLHRRPSLNSYSFRPCGR